MNMCYHGVYNKGQHKERFLFACIYFKKHDKLVNVIIYGEIKWVDTRAKARFTNIYFFISFKVSKSCELYFY